MAKQTKKAAKKTAAKSKIIKQAVAKKLANKKAAPKKAVAKKSGSKIIKQGVAKKSATKTATKKSATSSKIIKQGIAKKAGAKKAAGKSKIIKQGAPKKPTLPVKKAAVKRIETPIAPKPASSGSSRGFSLAAAGIAILDVTFRDVGAGLSNLTATFNGEEKSLNASGSISFNGVQKDDVIGIDGSSAGSTEIRISLPATPQQMNFSPGNFNDNFIIN